MLYWVVQITHVFQLLMVVQALKVFSIYFLIIYYILVYKINHIIIHL